MQPSEKTGSVVGVVVRSTKEPRVAARGGYPFRGLELRTSTDDVRIFVLCPELSGEHLYEFPLLCWEGACVAGFDLELNNRLDDGTLIYHATPDTDLVLEPHRLISVTEAVEAARCIRSADVHLRVGFSEPFWMAKGRMIHTLFDRLIFSSHGVVGTIFSDAFYQSLARFREILPGSGISVTDEELEEEARVHFSHLASWLESNRSRFDQVEVEADRYSTRMGLRGRADAVFYAEASPAVVELKSGKTVATDHLVQLVAYCLLFAPEVGALSEGCVLYSATGRAEGLPADVERLRRSILTGRNRTIALMRSHTGALQDISLWLDGATECRREECFSRRSCHRIFGTPARRAATWGGRERDYYNRWFRALSRELWTMEGDFAKIFDPSTLSQRVAEGITIPVSSVEVEVLGPLPAASSDRSGEQPESEQTAQRSVLVRAVLCAESPAEDLGTGEEVLLHRGNPVSRSCFRGRIVGSDEAGLHLQVRLPVLYAQERPCPQTEALTQTDGWYVDRIPFTRAREASRRALLHFLWSADRAVIQAVVSEYSRREQPGSDEPRPERPDERPLGRPREKPPAPSSPTPSDDLCFSEGLRAELTEEQERAIQSALDCSTYHLIHGPPGTGKTRVLARLIGKCLDKGERVLVACPTNVALDALLIAVLALGVRDFIRVALRSHVSTSFLDAIERTGCSQVLLGDLCALDMDLVSFRKLVRDKKLVAATAYQCASHPFFLRQRFDRVIVDEAGQLDEPSTLAPLTVGAKFILGGDHLQLPPVVQSRPGRVPQDEGACLEQSLFERLFLSAPDTAVSRLRTQYRMNQEVQDIPSRLFYDGSLVPSPEARSRRLSLRPGVSHDGTVNKVIDPEPPVVFVDVQGTTGSTARPEEAEAACKIVESLVASGVPSHEIGIITPYRAQQTLIRKRLVRTGNEFPRLTVDTVDRFQGGEREVIILSLCRSDEVTSFLADRKRLNVSLSRARSKLILLGHGPVLEGHPLFASILDGLERITMTAGG